MIEPIIDEKSHKRALRKIETLWNAAPGSREEQELDALATLVDAYERKQFPISPLDPIDAITARCEQLGWTRKDLEPLIGSRARVSEVLGRKRALTLPMIRKIHEAMQIPADVLITPGVARTRPSRSTSGKTAAKKSATRAA
jgi:HTH-type transcriptional regulator / antitoxin HigA